MYAKLIPALVLATQSCFVLNAQNGFEENGLMKTFSVTNINGKPFVNPAIDIAGSPFFRDEWNYATVKLANNSTYTNIPVRLNLLSQEVHFLNQDKSEIAVSPGIIAEIVFSDSLSKQKIQYDFKCGYAPVDDQNQQNFYLVLAEGKLNLLESLRKKIRVRKDDMSGEIKKEIITYDGYYFFINNALTVIRLNKSWLLEAMHDQQTKIEEFVKSNKLSYKSYTDLPKIINFYNSL